MLTLLGSHPEHLNPRDNPSISSMKLWNYFYCVFILFLVKYVSLTGRMEDRLNVCLCGGSGWLFNASSPHSTASVRLQKEWCYHVTELKEFNRNPAKERPLQQTHAEDLRGVKRRYCCSAHFSFLSMKHETHHFLYTRDIFQEESQRELQIGNVVVVDFRRDGDRLCRLSAVPRQMTTDQTTEDV